MFNLTTRSKCPFCDKKHLLFDELSDGELSVVCECNNFYAIVQDNIITKMEIYGNPIKGYFPIIEYNKLYDTFNYTMLSTDGAYSSAAPKLKLNVKKLTRKTIKKLLLDDSFRAFL